MDPEFLMLDIQQQIRKTADRWTAAELRAFSDSFSEFADELDDMADELEDEQDDDED